LKNLEGSRMEASSAVSPILAGPRDPALSISFQLLSGAQIYPFVPELCELLKIFAEWPYLYEPMAPDENYEYLQERYVQQARSEVCIAFADGKAIGAVMGEPLSMTPNNYQIPFTDDEKLNAFYIGELIILPEFRKYGVATQLYNNLLAIVKNSYKTIWCASVVREDHYRPDLKPAAYVSLESSCIKAGFVKQEDKVIIGKWRITGDLEESEHPMVCWRKTL
jgi:hypothetical protein